MFKIFFIYAFASGHLGGFHGLAIINKAAGSIGVHVSFQTMFLSGGINLDSILKSRDIALPAKIHLVKAMVFPVVTYGCEIWTIKKAGP